MNKLYVIKWVLSNGYVLSNSAFWNEEEMREKMRKNPEWVFEREEDNDVHKIVIAR